MDVIATEPSVDLRRLVDPPARGRRAESAEPGGPAEAHRAHASREVVVEREVTPYADVVPRQRSERLNRIVNVTLAVMALLVTAPILLLVALSVKLTSRGPLIYRQTRVGIDRRWSGGGESLYDRRVRDLGGTVFTIYKFRTMTTDAERQSGAVWATAGDARVTLVGRFLRTARLDELPQLYNVIRGDMNIVGPRPERPSIFQWLRQDIPEYPVRQRTKPGITGWAQVNQSYDADIDDVRSKVRYDLEYLQRQGLAEDVRIMLKTVPVMLLKRGGW